MGGQGHLPIGSEGAGAPVVQASEALKQQLQAKASGEPTKPQSPADTVRGWLDKLKPEIQRALPKHITVDRLVRVCLTAIRTNPKLLACDTQSLMAAVMLSAQFGLEPGPLGHAYFVPFWDKHSGKTLVQWIAGYKGYLDLMWRSNKLLSVAVRVVYEKDEFHYQYGLQDKLVHVPYMGAEDRGKPKAYYLVGRFKDGGHHMRVMSPQDIEYHRGFSKSSDKGPWVDFYEEMALKTVLRTEARWMPLSIEVQRVTVADEGTPAEVTEDLAAGAYEAEFNVADNQAEAAGAAPAGGR